MITGFNTDIPHEGVTYHVQTEDKGLDTPLILSLVYVGGAIIASKRTRYDDLLQTGFDEKVLTERLQRQHKLICAAIRAGRIEELKLMGGRDSAHDDEGVAKNGHTSAAGEKVERRRKKKSAETRAFTPEDASETLYSETVDDDSERQGTEDSGHEQNSNIEILTTVMDEISALSDVAASPAQEFQQPERIVPLIHEEVVVEEPPQFEQSPVVHEPFVAPPQKVVSPRKRAAPPEAGQADSDELYLTLLDDEGDFRAGQLATVKVHVGRGAYGGSPVHDASVTVKVLGTSFRPLILATSTDERGVAVVRALLPRFTSGRAAIIIRAVADDDAAELRRIIHQA
ncbi:MAG: hypothetical protein H7Z38_19785 [Rubrivivax sp.]|nr:hypothetical protein [Pyrinomonadaceae bacterium]